MKSVPAEKPEQDCLVFFRRDHFLVTGKKTRRTDTCGTLIRFSQPLARTFPLILAHARCCNTSCYRYLCWHIRADVSAPRFDPWHSTHPV